MQVGAAASQGVGPSAEVHQERRDLVHEIYLKVIHTIENSEKIPGYDTEVFKELKPGLIERMEELYKKGFIEVTGSDKEIRPYFVCLQGIIETVLAEELNVSVTELRGMIHTPEPATPLCNPEGTVIERTVDPSIAEDPARLITVQARTTIVRNYLRKGGTLYIAYPKEGLSKRLPDQQKIYKEELETYRYLLVDVPLNCETIEVPLHGAIYTFKDQGGESCVFAIKMTQANNVVKDEGHFGLWFGNRERRAIKSRMDEVLEFVNSTAPQAISL